MKKSELRNLDTNHIPVQRLTGLLETFALKHSARLLPDIMERAEHNGASYREFLLDLLQTEVKGRNERRRKRNYAAAQPVRHYLRLVLHFLTHLFFTPRLVF